MILLATLTRSYAPSIRGLCALIAHHAGLDRRLAPLVLLAWGRLNRTLSRLDTLLSRFQAGRLPRRRIRQRVRTPSVPRPTPGMPAGSPPVKAPSRNAWLVHLVPAACQYRGHLEILLADPEIAALAAAAPQAGRLLRPLARMLGVQLPDCLRLPPRRRKPRPPKPPRPESRTALLRRLRGMTGAELKAWFHPLPPHFNLPIPGWRTIRRKIAAA